MLTNSSIEKYNDQTKIAINELFDNAFKNQKCSNDLILILANATRTHYSEETLKRLKISNYQIGHDIVHFRYSTFFDFINQYKRVKDEQEYEVIKNKQLYDETMVQMQLLSYMKFWETDLILKRLYNLSKLSQGKDYLWDVKQQELNNRRRLVKDEIQNPIKTLCPKFFAFLDDVYSRQLRNAIAHSQYYVMYNEIQLTNKEENRFYHLDRVSFKKWDEIFTKVILMHNHMINNFNKYHDYYVKKAENLHNGLMIFFPEKMDNGINKNGWIKYDSLRKVWYWGNQ